MEVIYPNFRITERATPMADRYFASAPPPPAADRPRRRTADLPEATSLRELADRDGIFALYSSIEASE
jgi:hypothetical protein